MLILIRVDVPHVDRYMGMSSEALVSLPYVSLFPVSWHSPFPSPSRIAPLRCKRNYTVNARVIVYTYAGAGVESILILRGCVGAWYELCLCLSCGLVITRYFFSVLLSGVRRPSFLVRAHTSSGSGSASKSSTFRSTLARPGLDVQLGEYARNSVPPVPATDLPSFRSCAPRRSIAVAVCASYVFLRGSNGRRSGVGKKYREWTIRGDARCCAGAQWYRFLCSALDSRCH